jgi:hypothetical protein
MYTSVMSLATKTYTITVRSREAKVAFTTMWEELFDGNPEGWCVDVQVV